MSNSNVLFPLAHSSVGVSSSYIHPQCQRRMQLAAIVKEEMESDSNCIQASASDESVASGQVKKEACECEDCCGEKKVDDNCDCEQCQAGCTVKEELNLEEDENSASNGFRVTEIDQIETNGADDSQVQSQVEAMVVANEAICSPPRMQSDGEMDVDATSSSGTLRRSSRTRRVNVNYAAGIEDEDNQQQGDTDYEPESEEDTEESSSKDVSMLEAVSLDVKSGSGDEATVEALVQVASAPSSAKTHKGKRSYSCTECGKKFVLHSHLKRHIQVHTNQRPFSCLECPQRFRQFANLKAHLCAVHRKMQPYTCMCQHCKRRFSFKSSATKHLKTHQTKRSRPFSCPVDGCGKAFTEKVNLTRHLRIHEGLKPFKCTHCEKAFAQNGDLKVHLRTHTGEKLGKCKVCKKAFSSAADARRHEKAIHGLSG